MQEFEMDVHFDFDIEDEYLCNNEMNNYASDILGSKYDKVPINNAAVMQEHLTPKQQTKLCNVLCKHKILFDSKLGKYPHKQFHLELIDSTEPVYSKPYSVPY